MAQKIGDKFAKLRDAVGMSQTEFATALGVSHGYISHVEAGRRNPSGSLILVARTKFNVNPTWWETGMGEVIKRRLDDADEKKPPESLEAIVQKLIDSELDMLPTSGEKFELAADLRDFLRERRAQRKGQ